jgi:catechol 2,3-dioxygenase-like lactoylglutathione lyase family enzyme
VAAIRYLVADVEVAIAFYRERLGFTLDRQMGPAFAIVTRDGLSLWLAGPKSSAARAMPDGRRPEPGGWNRLVLEVDDLDGEVRSLRNAGVTFRNDVVEGPGGRQILLEDPDGNPIELFQSA